jgi:hypothetical protein
LDSKTLMFIHKRREPHVDRRHGMTIAKRDNALEMLP